MKEIKAYIKPHKLAAVTLALRGVDGFPGMSVVDVRGFGRAVACQSDVSDYLPHAKIEINCRDGQVKGIVSVIEKFAHTGLHGDGKIYVSDIKTAVRISTGERGKNAI